MADWHTALRKAGIASPKALAEATAQQQLDSEAVATRRKKEDGERERRLEVLSTTNSADTFRREAKKLLLLAWSLIDDIVRLAHDRGMKEKNPRLIASLLGLRKSLKGDHLYDDQRRALIEDAFNWK